MKNKKEFKTIHNNIQKEALINEIKGNLFEYLVAHSCATQLSLESQFLSSFSGEMKKMMNDYEKWLRVNDRELISKLRDLALETSILLVEYLQKISAKDKSLIDKVFVIGKMSGGFHNDHFKEADLLFCSSKETYPISLKLSKKNAFVNTKSAGAKSFISKYFSTFEDSSLLQNSFDGVVDKLFYDMGNSLYQRRSLNFDGRFDSLWDGPDLPGELSGDDQEDLYMMYRKLSKNLYDVLFDLHVLDQKKFISSIAPLLGGGSADLISVTCFHFDKKVKGDSNKYIFSHVEIKDFKFSTNVVKFFPYKNNTASFELLVADSVLQIRIKPMNKFTSPSYKVNCSVRSAKESTKC